MEVIDYRPPTETEAAKMVEAAYQMGLDGDYYDDESRSIQWDDLFSFFEGSTFSTDWTPIELPSDSDWLDHPLIKAIKAAYRRGRKDQDS